MIRMEQPSFCFNSIDIDGPQYEMWRTMVGRGGMTASQLAAEIVSANVLAMQAFGCSLRNIILNTHGFSGGLLIGGRYRSAMHESDLVAFTALKPFNVGTIWIVSCEAAGSERGRRFCQTLANAANTQVVASDSPQEVTAWQAIGLFAARQRFIDDFEGSVYGFTPGAGMRKIDPERDIFTVQESRW